RSRRCTNRTERASGSATTSQGKEPH
ncbi:MAG: hypothetical protein AVDCRST_MAG93-8612, partial [uncultured Chloroflexia bacterium]